MFIIKIFAQTFQLSNDLLNIRRCCIVLHDNIQHINLFIELEWTVFYLMTHRTNDPLIFNTEIFNR